jgi:hypothetical protein
VALTSVVLASVVLTNVVLANPTQGAMVWDAMSRGARVRRQTCDATRVNTRQDVIGHAAEVEHAMLLSLILDTWICDELGALDLDGRVER